MQTDKDRQRQGERERDNKLDRSHLYYIPGYKQFTPPESFVVKEIAKNVQYLYLSQYF